jgi:ketosteroid isomerase-like protein
MDILSLNKKLDDMIAAGKAMDAFEELYADDVVMAENFDSECVGKEANRKREIEFFSSVEKLNAASVGKSAVSGDTSFTEWHFDCTFKGGARAVLQQVAVRQWKDGKIVHERFYYKPNYTPAA